MDQKARTKKIAVVLLVEQLDELAERARRKHRSQSSLLRDVVDLGFQQLDKIDRLTEAVA